jgi:glycosyltransferase involved in cell wall biosynthesis
VPLKIAIVASPVTPVRPGQVGGAQAFISDLASGLARRGHEVRLHCSSGSEVPGVELVMVPAPADAEDALVMPGGAPPPRTPGVIAAFERMFNSIASDTDVISQHAFDAPAFDLAARLPVLHTLHLPPLVPEVVQAAAKVDRANLATVSESSRALWKMAGVEIGLVLRNGVPDLAVPSGPVDLAALVAGRLSPEKGIEHALRAARAAGLPVRIAGAAYDPSYAVDLAGAEWLGALQRDDLRRLMARSAVTICAARWEEPFGLVAAEAQMAGCPVAGYRRGGIPEVVDDGVSGILVEGDDIESLIGAIRHCLTLDRGRVRSSALHRLGMEGALDRYEAALKEVVR